MSQKKLNQKGLGSVEVLLIIVIVAIVGGTSYFVYKASSKSTDTINQANLASQSTTTSKTKKEKQAEQNLIDTAVKNYQSSSATAAPTIVNVKSVVGNNAKGTYGDSSNSSSVFVAHKDGSTWHVVFEGQQLPGKDIGTKYDLPNTWYSTKY